MRRVVDLLLDRHAHLRAVVIDFGGFLGVRSRKIAIDWWLIRFMPDDPDVPLVLTKSARQKFRRHSNTVIRDHRPLWSGCSGPIPMALDKYLPSVSVVTTVDGTENSLCSSVGNGLDALNLFVANVQTRFSPFIAVFLTSQGWTQTAIGLSLSIGTDTSIARQVPAGALVDAATRKTVVALFSVLAFAASALLFALFAGFSSLGARLGRNGQQTRHGRLCSS
jgi:hypothetical protein